MSGWIKLHRSLLDWEWYGDPNVVLVFLDLLLNANHKPSKFRGIELKSGEQVWGRKSASERTGLSEKQIRVAMEKLKKTGEVGHKRAGKLSIISIVNWEFYQQEGQEKGRKRATKGPQTRSKEDKNIRNDSIVTLENDDFEDIWREYPSRLGSNPKAQALSAYRARIKEGYSHDQMLSAVKEYKIYCDHEKGPVGSEDRKYVMAASSFFGPKKMGFLEDWKIGKQNSKGRASILASIARFQTDQADLSDDWE